MTRAVLALALLTACQRDPSRADSTEVFGAAWEACDADAIRLLAARHAFTTAFEPCGSNDLRAFAWSPDGRSLLFELTTGAYVLDAAATDKRTVSVPVENPIGPGAWLGPARVALPIGPAEDSTTPRIATWDLVTGAVVRHDLPGLADPLDLAPGDGPDDLLFTATKGGRRSIWQLDLAHGTLSEPFPWAAELPVERFTYQPAQDAALLAAGGTVTLYDRVGTELGAWAPATRGTLHPDGRWVALEHEGDPVSLYDQRTWDEPSEPAGTRERTREELDRDLPEWAPRDTRPPTVSLVDRITRDRWVFTGFQGREFQWYEAHDYYASVLLWGFEGKQTRGNVVLGDLADRMRAIERGQELQGVQRFRLEAAP